MAKTKEEAKDVTTKPPLREFHFPHEEVTVLAASMEEALEKLEKILNSK